MLMTRRTLVAVTASGLAGLATPLLWAGVPRSFEDDIPGFDKVARGEYFGDHYTVNGKEVACLHWVYHPGYQKVFSELLQCSCGVGECRVTRWRKSKLGSPRGFDIIVNRQWRPLPVATKMPSPEQMKQAPELYREFAHVCAYNDEDGDTPTIECAIINRSDA